MRHSLTVVIPTYNRFRTLPQAIGSIRSNADGLLLRFVVVDGGSTDGTPEWLGMQPDVCFLSDKGPHTGAVRPANRGYAVALSLGCDCVGVADDDSISIDPGMWAVAVKDVMASPTNGGAAFAANLHGNNYDHERVHGLPYPNFGVVRAEAARQVARASGDPTGLCPLNPLYSHYGADSEMGAWLWKLGWKVSAFPGRMSQLATRDVLHQRNINTPDPASFASRWSNPANIQARVVYASWKDVPCPMSPQDV